MISILYIVVCVLILLLSCLGYGKMINSKMNVFSQILFGFTAVLSLSEIIDLFLVVFYCPTGIIFLLYAIVLVVGIVFNFLRKTEMNLKQSLFLVIYLVLMIFVCSNRTLGEPSFDSAFYLSHVIEGTNSLTLGGLSYESGKVLSGISAMYDLQSYYHLNSFLLFVIQHVNQVLFGTTMITSHIFVWSMTILFYIFLFCFTEMILDHLKSESSLLKLALRIFLLGCIGNFYWNNSLAFFGNTYRQLFSAVMMYTLYIVLEKRDFSFKSFFVLSMLSAAMLSVSSSALFICFILFFCFVCISFLSDFHYRGTKYILLLFPLMCFALLYAHCDLGIGVLPLVGVICFVAFCLFYDLILERCIGMWMIKWLKKIVFFFFPFIMLVISVVLWKESDLNLFMFFENYSSMDMIWDYFNFSDLWHLVFNSIYIIGIILYIKNNFKNHFGLFLLYIVIMFINPVHVIVIHKFLASIVFYRSYECFFNYFTCILCFVELAHLFRKYKVFEVILLLCTFSFSLEQIFSYYHHFYEPYDEYNKLYKVDHEEVDMLSVFHDVISYEDERAIVVSQLDSVKGYIPNISLAFNFREVSLYSVNSGKSDLVELFYPREYAGQQMFDEEPDFQCACDELIENRIDYVIIDKEQVYLKDGHFEQIYYLVRDCAEIVYENRKYALFRFYW